MKHAMNVLPPFEVGDRILFEITDEHSSPGVVTSWIMVRGERKYSVLLDSGTDVSHVHVDWLSHEGPIVLPSPDPTSSLGLWLEELA